MRKAEQMICKSGMVEESRNLGDQRATVFSSVGMGRFEGYYEWVGAPDFSRAPIQP